MADKMKCPICGEETASFMGRYRNDGLCKKHAYELKNGTLIACDKCGGWHNADRPCKCEKQAVASDKSFPKYTKCVACGGQTSGYAFCFNCYKKYSDEERKRMLSGKVSDATRSVADKVKIPTENEKTAAKTSAVFLRDKDKTVAGRQDPDVKKRDTDNIPIEQQKQADGKCIVCGADSPNGSLCRSCYYEMLDFKDTFDKNAKVFELKDYYFNLRSNIYRMKNFDYVKSNCNKLMALSVLTKDLYDEQSLTDRIVSDIKDIIAIKAPKEEQKSSEYTKIQDSRKEEVARTADGHYVKSHPESVIDDILYDLRIVHCYEKKVPISADEQAMTADWFIPVTDGRHGIYIEYWGMNTKEYLENKERKKKSYKEHDIPLIEIEKDEYKDRRGLEDRLISEMNAMAYKYFRVTDFIR